MDSPKLRRDLRVSLHEVCESMRSHKRAVDFANSEFKQCSSESRKTIEHSYRTLDRLNRGNGPLRMRT